MPNTLAHAGAQGLASRMAVPDTDLKWVYLGCVIPDVPWILQRAARMTAIGVDPYLLRSYVIVQASLFGCLILSGAVAMLARKTWTVFAVLGGNSVLHLVIDAAQTKWGNGVHFFAPLSWETTNWGLFWPSSLPTYVLTVLGLLCLGWYWTSSVDEPPQLWWPSVPRLMVVFALVGVYFFGPLALLQEPIEADTHSLEVLSQVQERVNRPVEMDRATYISVQKEQFLKHFGGRVRVRELEIPSPATVSIQGEFVGENMVRVDRIHVHPTGLRDYPSYLGLGLIVAVWGTAALKHYTARP